MKVDKKEAQFLQKAILKWKNDELISEKQAEELNKSYDTIKFDWRSLSFYAFVFAIACIVIAGVALLADKWLMQMLEKIVDASEGYKAVFFAIISAILFYYGQRLRIKKPDKIYSHTSVTLLAIITMGVSIGYLSIVFGNGNHHFSLFILIGTAIYAALAVYFRSRLIWITALLGSIAWFCAETGYLSGWGNYFLGMNYIVRIIPFSLLLLLAFFFLRKRLFLKDFYHSSVGLLLLSLLSSFWMASIFGNYGNLKDWSTIEQFTLLPWSFAFLLATGICIWVGAKFNFPLIREIGVIFLIINVYTRYFEYAWNVLHPALFFALLGLSFWIIGKKAEKIWTLGNVRKP